MNVLGICSGRKNGNTEMMMKEAFAAVEERCGADCKLVRLQEASIRSCTGCETCMVNHLQGNWDFRCIHKNDSDHYFYIEQLMRQADAIIVSSPAYNLLPAGILIQFLNKLHASGDYRVQVTQKPKIGATFSLGGTDWTNFTQNMCMFVAMELCGTFEAVVDSIHFDFVPAYGSVLLEEEILARVRTLGENVADALLAQEQGETISYRGDAGVCPDCHGRMLELRQDGFYCPQCLTKASVVTQGDNIQIRFTPEQRKKNRWSLWGKELHDNNIRRGHAKAGEGKELIQERKQAYLKREYAVRLPALE